MAAKDAKELAGGTALVILGTVTVPAFMLFGPGGAAAEQANLISFFFFSILGFAAVTALIVKTVLHFQGTLRQYPGFDKYLTIHSPEHTWLGERFEPLQSPTTTFLVFTVLSMVVGVSVSTSGTFVSGVPNLVDGSVSDTTTLVLAVEPAVSAETLFFQFLILMGQTAAIYTGLVNRGVSPFQSAFISKFISVITTTIFAFLYHSFRYGTAETAQGGVLVLFGVLNSVTALTNSIIPAYMIHGSSNLFAKASAEGIFSSEFAVVAAALIAVICVAALFVRFFAKGGSR